MADIKKLWEGMKESNARFLSLKFYKKKGDKKPFRMMVLVEGEQEVEDVSKALDEFEGETVSSGKVDLQKVVCPECGTTMEPDGSPFPNCCYKCPNCGETSGVS